MRITEIELDNFKSFGKKTVIPVLDGFTTISGPNGSGKSNIVDSLLFALGLSSTRTMRAERLPDLLNNLSGKNEAKVTVKFANNEGDKIEVSRRIRVKGESYTSTYNLNGKVATLTEIHEELQRYNVSPTGFNVIMQGDVTGIVTMSPSERRKIIDELAGVADFDRRIDQANNELESVGERIEHQRIVMGEIMERLEQLRADRDQAMKYLELKEQKDGIERDLIYVRLKEIQEAVTKEQAAIEKLEEKEEGLAEALEKKEVELLELRAEIGRIEEEIQAKGGNEQLLLAQELENKRGDLTREENKLSNLDGVIGEKEKVQANLNSQIEAIDKHLRRLNKEKKQSNEDFQAVKVVLSEKQGALSAVLAEIDVVRQDKDRSTDEITSIHTKLQNLRDKKHKLEVKRTELSSRKEHLEKDIESIRGNATSSISESASLKSLVAQMESKFQDDEALVIGIERSIQQLEGEIESTREEIEEKRSELEKVNGRIIEVKTHKEVAGESGYGRAVEAVLKAGIDGIWGTIGQLGKVDERYTTALETAIGPRLGHIVVENDEVAQECINFLKRKKAGRATFVPLNKLNVQGPGLLPNRDGVVDFAYNLIDFDPKFARAFQYACGQTIVVEDMTVGRSLLGQARMVTLEGELFERTGSITGGTMTKARLHFTHKGESDINVLQAKAQGLAEDIKSLQSMMKELSDTLAEDRAKHTQSKEQLAKKRAELENKRAESDKLAKDVETMKPRLRESGDEIEAIDEQLAQLDDSLNALDNQIQEMHEQVQDMTAGGHNTKIERLISESEELQEALEAIDQSAKEVQRQLDKIETEERVEQGNRDRLQAQLDELNKEIEEISAAKPDLVKAVGELKQAIVELEKKLSEVSDELQNLRDTKEHMLESVTEKEVEKTKIDQDLIHLEEERQQRKLNHFDLEKQLNELKVELEEILKENPDYQPPAEGTVEQLKAKVERLDKRMRALEPVNMKALEEYQKTEDRQKELDEYMHTLSQEREEIIQRIAGYGELKKRTFMETFDAINQNFQEIFAELSHGHGRLELENADDPFAGGLIIRAQPRDKKMQRIEALSGGEKSLTALSFVFAFQRYAPAPFYAFDEVDMMLDGFNAEMLARRVKRHSEQAQFVVVSLRRPMIENADHAIGVSLRADGYSRVVGIKEVHLPEDDESEPEEASA